MKQLQFTLLGVAMIVIIAGAISLTTEVTVAQEQPPGGGRCPTSWQLCSEVCNCSGGINYYCQEGGKYMRCFGDAQCSAHCVH